MSAKIRVGKYLIETKAHGWNLSNVQMVDVKDKETKEPTGEQKESIVVMGFYSEIGQLANRLVQGEMIQSDMKSVQDFIDCIKSLESAILEASK